MNIPHGVPRETGDALTCKGMPVIVGSAGMKDWVQFAFGAQFVNRNLGDYHIPVAADIGEIETVMLDEVDTMVNPLGIKGLGKLGCTGVNAAIANAVFRATGHRQRKFPIRIGDLPHMATTGGNLLQWTHYYFTDISFPACNKHVPGSGCRAIGGSSRIHAILGQTDKGAAGGPFPWPISTRCPARRPGWKWRCGPMS